ncbi:uncharacterized protein LOC135817726 [Sycon ciliatum]|uniref:uncharacterized protein LOC135817726 n=1 Tax=Sycon ciliatum TaxID=27933 RepID=UPI0031F6B2C1
MEKGKEDRTPAFLREIRANYLEKLHQAFCTPAVKGGLRKRKRGHRRQRCVNPHDGGQDERGGGSRQGDHNTIVLLTGLSGVGKSSIVDCYARTAQERGYYQRGVWRINALSDATVELSIRNILVSAKAPFSCLSQRSDPASPSFWQRIMMALHPTSDMLFIVDNLGNRTLQSMSDEEAVSSESDAADPLSVMWKFLLPNSNYQHRLLIISQNGILQDCVSRHIAQRLEVHPLTSLQSSWLLARQTGILCTHCPMPVRQAQLWKQLQRACRACQRENSHCCQHCLLRQLRACQQAVPTVQPKHCCTHGQETHDASTLSACTVRQFVTLSDAADMANGLPLVLEWISKQAEGDASQLAAGTLDAGQDSAAARPEEHEVANTMDSVWSKTYSLISTAAKQLLCTAALLNPHRISCAIFLAAQHSPYVPAELRDLLFPFDVAAAPNTSTEIMNRRAVQSLVSLLCELRHFSLVMFVASNSRAFFSYGRSDSSQDNLAAYDFSIHGIARQHILAGMFSTDGSELQKYLSCCLDLLSLSTSACCSRIEIEVYLIPHVMAVSPVTLLQLVRRFAGVHRKSHLSTAAIESLPEEVRLQWVHLLSYFLKLQKHNSYRYKFFAKEVFDGIVFLTGTLQSSETTLQLQKSTRLQRKYYQKTLDIQSYCSTCQAAIPVILSLPRKIIFQLFSIGLAAMYCNHVGDYHSKRRGFWPHPLANLLSSSGKSDRPISHHVATETNPLIQSQDHHEQVLAYCILDMLCLIGVSDGCPHVMNRHVQDNSMGERLLQCLNALSMVCLDLYTHNSRSTATAAAVAAAATAAAPPSSAAGAPPPSAAEVTDAHLSGGSTTGRHSNPQGTALRTCHRHTDDVLGKKKGAPLPEPNTTAERAPIASVADLSHSADVYLIKRVCSLEGMYGGSYFSGKLYAPLLAILLHRMTRGQTSQARITLCRLMCYIPEQYQVKSSHLHRILAVVTGELSPRSQYLVEIEMYD